MGAIDLKIEDLDLDLENPRFVRAGNQREALQRVLDDQQEKLVVLAKSIADEGLNPLDRLLVMKGKSGTGRFIALEGNRRVAALRILANPNLLDGLDLKPSIRKSCENLAKRFSPDRVEPVACYEVDGRQSGNTWVHLRHTGENDGRGVVNWSGIAASRFRGRDPALQALEFVRSYGGLSEDEKRSLEDRFPITTLDRLLSSREVRRRLGFDVKKQKLVSSLPADEVLKPLRRIVLDLAEGTKNVSDLKNQTQQIAYVESFERSCRPDMAKTGRLRPIEKLQQSDFKYSAVKSAKRKRVPDPSDRKTLIPRAVRLNITDNRIAEIFAELRSLRVDTARNAVAVLFRVFLELSSDHHLVSKQIPLKFKDLKTGHEGDKKLSKKVGEVVDSLVAVGSNRKDFNGVVRGLSVSHSPLSIDLLHDYVHNRFVTPKTRDLIGAWNDSQRYFEEIWK